MPQVDTKDALLHAISEEFVEAVEMLLDHEDQNEHKEGQSVSKIWSTSRTYTRELSRDLDNRYDISFFFDSIAEKNWPWEKVEQSVSLIPFSKTLQTDSQSGVLGELDTLSV